MGVTLEDARARRGVEPMVLITLGSVALVIALALPRILARVRDSDFLELAASIQDDSFYYLLPAYHFKTKLFFTFDGLTPSYGFQPMYELLLAGLAVFHDDFESFFRGAMAMGVWLHVLTSVLLVLLVMRGADAKAPWLRNLQLVLAGVAGLFYFTRGTVLLSAMTCKENALTALVFVGLLLVATADARTPAERRRLSLVVGLGLSALLLCRMLPTSLVIAGLVGLGALLRWRRPWELLGAFTVPLVLWFGYATLAFGHPLPTSARVKALASSSLPITWEVVSRDGWDYLKSALDFSMGMPGRLYLPQQDAARMVFDSSRSSLWMALAVSTLVALVVAGLWRSRREQRDLQVSSGVLGLVAALLVGLLFAYVAQGSLIATRRPGELTYYIWYVFDAPVLFAVALGIACVRGLSMLEAARESWREKSLPMRPVARTFALGVVMVAGALAVFIARVPREYGKLSRLQPFTSFDPVSQSWPHTMIRAGLWLKQNVPLQPGERVACYSCGSLGMLLPGHVMNLDGLANDDSARYLLGGSTTTPYVTKMRPRFYIDVHPVDFDEAGIQVKPLHILPFGFKRKPGYLIAELSYPTP
ncbi:hypothetical protein MFU01_15480 [Myxococcus fulvus]|uniref:Glycosyltransferase RgtA/B/C/D-like domain-containing protein n=1 Tax=Myxococcus fulvus TaxID=33 RepID=A0A511SX81_MYXFU|nr:hypothetical protein MFU01_15480 [Myxococcus fulvus]